MALALDGSGTSSTATVVLTTALAGIICVVATINGATIISIADDASNIYAKRASVANNGGNPIEFWYAVSQAGVTNNNIVVTFSGSPSFSRLSAFGVAGADMDDVFDGNGSLPALGSNSGGGAADPLSVSTTANDTFIIGAFRMSATDAPTAGAGFTGILSGEAGTFTLTEYQIVSDPQASLSVTIDMGAGNSDGGIADAIKAAVVVEDVAITPGSYWNYRKRLEEDEQERDAWWNKQRERIEKISRLVDGVSEKVPDDVPEAQVVKTAEAAVEKAAEKLTEDIPPPAFDYAGLAARVKSANAAVKQAEAALKRYEARKRREMEEQEDDEDVLLLMG